MAHVPAVRRATLYETNATDLFFYFLKDGKRTVADYPYLVHFEYIWQTWIDTRHHCVFFFVVYCFSSRKTRHKNLAPEACAAWIYNHVRVWRNEVW